MSVLIFINYGLCQKELDNNVILKLHFGLSNPVNDVIKARQISVLTSIAPKASYVDIMKKMENGIGEVNYLHKTLEIIRRNYGTNKDLLASALVKSFDFTHDQATYFLEGGNGWEGYLNNMKIFEGIAYDTKIKKWVDNTAKPLNTYKVKSKK